MASAAGGGRKPGAPDAWPLVGRSDELQLVLADLAAGRAGVVIAGVAGVGKTRLAREVAAATEALGHGTRWATATRAGSDLPFAAVAHLVPRRLLDDPGPALLAGIVDAVTAEGGDRRTVVVVDDAHLLDDRSAALVHALAADQRCFIVATTRSGDRAPDAVVALWKDGLTRRVEVQPVGRDDVEVLLHRRLGAAVEEQAVERLWDLTRGNVLYLREVVDASLRHGTLRRSRDGRWQLDGDVAVGERLTELVRQRIGEREAAEREVLEVLAVVEPVELAAMEAVASHDALAQLEREGIVAAALDQQRWSVTFVHPLYGEAARAELPQLSRRRVAGRLAAWLEERGMRRRGDLLRVAELRYLAGGGSSEVFVAAARRAWALGSGPAAERFARAALGGDRDEEALYLLGSAVSDQGRFEEALRLWDRIEPSTDEMEAALAVSVATTLAYALGDVATADEHLDATLARLGETPAAAQVRDVRRAIHTVRGQTAEPAGAGEEPEGGDPEAAVRRALVELSAAVLGGRPRQVLERAGPALHAAHRARDQHPMGLTWITLLTFYAHVTAGDLTEAAALAHSAAASAGDDVVGAAMWEDAVAFVALLRGRAPEAAERFEATTRLHEVRDDGSLSINRLHLAAALASAGDAAGARRALQESRDSRPSIVPTMLPAERVEAAVLHAEGRSEEAAALVGAWARGQREGGHPLWAALGLHDAARYGDAGVAGDLVSTVATMDGIFPVLAAHASALATGDADGLLEAAAAFEGWGMDLLAAEAAAAAARALATARRTVEAIAAEETARRLATACGVASSQPAAVDPLTAREREVVDLAAEGLADRLIADRLFLSVRTVHAHLRSAYAKLGVSGRGELRRLRSR